MTNKKTKRIFSWAQLMSYAMAVMLLSASGCTYYMPVAVSSTSIGNQGEIPVKVVSGRSEASYFLFLGPFGDDSLQAALEDARSQGDGDTLANVFVDRKLFCFPLCGFSLYTSIETRITGTLVKYQDERSRQFQKNTAKQPPISDSSDRSKANIPPQVAYDQMLTAFGQDQLTAEALHNSYSGQTRSNLKQFITTKRGDDSAWNWKLKMPANASENEKRFLLWYVKTYTSYKLTE